MELKKITIDVPIESISDFLKLTSGFEVFTLIKTWLGPAGGNPQIDVYGTFKHVYDFTKEYIKSNDYEDDDVEPIVDVSEIEELNLFFLRCKDYAEDHNFEFDISIKATLHTSTEVQYTCNFITENDCDPNADETAAQLEGEFNSYLQPLQSIYGLCNEIKFNHEIVLRKTFMIK